MLFKRFSFTLTALTLLAAATASADGPCSRIFSIQLQTDPSVETAHAAITSDLYNGRIVSIRPFSENDNKNQLYLTTVEARDPYTGQIRSREAFYKPAIWGDGDGWARTSMEYVAYALNRVLAMDYVPPVAYRKNMPVDVNGHHYEFGVLIYKVPEYTPLMKLPGERFHGTTSGHGEEPAFHDAVISDHRILSVLLQNGDGHHRNLGQGRHWVDGAVRPAFIDWGASLRHGTDVSLTHYPVFGNSDPVTRVRSQTLERLRRLQWTDFQPWVEAGFMSDGEAHSILSTRDRIVGELDGRIASQGENAVVIRF